MAVIDPQTSAPPMELLARYSTYPEAEAAVERLVDLEFPVETLSIVSRGLRRVEQVTGRRSVLSAFADGGITGVAFGALFGLLLSIFVQIEDGVDPFAMVVWFALIGGGAVGSWRAVGHWMQRGRRDFVTIPVLSAERFEVWVQPELAEQARMLLGSRDERASD